MLYFGSKSTLNVETRLVVCGINTYIHTKKDSEVQDWESMCQNHYAVHFFIYFLTGK